MIGLSIFMVVATVLTWLVYATLRRDIGGATTSYSAMFTDVYGLRVGDDVRMAGVRVGRVENIELAGKLAKVSFLLQNEQHLLRQHCRIGDLSKHHRSALSGTVPRRAWQEKPLPGGSVIPVEQTDPSFDVGKLLNGFEPLFSTAESKGRR